MIEQRVAISNYLSHTNDGVAIRELARQQEVHASTVLRQIQRIENARDDLLIEAFLKDPIEPSVEVQNKVFNLLRIPQTCIIASASAKRAIVAASGGKAIDRFDHRFVGLWRLLGLIKLEKVGKEISRYNITDKAAITDAPNDVVKEDDAGETSRNYMRKYDQHPLTLLGRRKSKDGSSFLTKTEIDAGLLFHAIFITSKSKGGENFSKVNWENIKNAVPSQGNILSEFIADAQRGEDLFSRGIYHLGDGLADVVLLTCCFGIGIQEVEKRLGWSNRSGKIVLKIALGRLATFLKEQDDGMIG